jgi:hypothetical protein
MELQEIDVTIDANGQVHVQVRGAKGMSCLDLTRDLEAALGGEIISREMTPEAEEPIEAITQNKVRMKGKK